MFAVSEDRIFRSTALYVRKVSHGNLPNKEIEMADL
jgi:hypothetical protein